jgi:hypothetical protein
MVVYIVIAGFTLFAILVLLIMSKIPKLKEKALERLKSTFNSLRYNGIIRSVFISFLKLALNTCHILGGWRVGNKVILDTFLPALAIFLVLISFMVWAFVFICKNREKLADEETKAKYENMYRNINLKNHKGGLYYIPVFLVRRLIFTLIFNLAFTDGCIQI